MCAFIDHMKHYVGAYQYSNYVTILPFFMHDF